MNGSEWQTRKQRIDTRPRSLSPVWELVRCCDDLNGSALTRQAVFNSPPLQDPTDESAGKLLGRIAGGRTDSAKNNENPGGADGLINQGA